MSLIVPVKILDQHVAVLGKTGSGKSSAMRYLVEDLLDRKKPVCIIDPKGDWWGLKSSADGKSAGYEVVIFGGRHADVPIDEWAGKSVAELVATGNRPAIIDLGGWTVHARTKFFIDFSEALFSLTRGQRWLVIDEVHNFAPKGKIMSPEAGMMLHWANRLASEGRGKGINLVVASQRPQKVHNDLLTSCETLISMRVIHPRDREAIAEWLEGAGDQAKAREVLDSLAAMKRGEGWVWSPEIEFGPKRVKFPMFTTFDSFAAMANSGTVQLKGWAAVNLEEVKAKLAATIEKAKAEDPRELQKRVRDLEAQLKVRPAEVKEKIVKERVVKEVPKVVKVEAVAEGKVARLEKVAEKIGAELKRMNDLLFVVKHSQEVGEERVKAIVAAGAGLPRADDSHRPGTLIPTGSNPRRADPSVPKAAPSPRPIVPAGEEDQSLSSKCEVALMTAFAQHPEGLTKLQCITYAGYKPSGTISDIFSKFARNGWMEPGGAGFRATSSGLESLGAYEPLPTGADLRRKMVAEEPLPESKLLNVLFNNHPNSLTKLQIIEAAGYKPSGTISDAFSKFSRLNWMVKSGGGFRASDDFFKE